MPCAQVVVHENTIRNGRRAVVTRVFCVKDKENPGEYLICPEPVKGAFVRFQNVARKLGRRVRVRAVVPLEEVPSMYVGSKRARYQRAYESLCIKPLNLDDARIRSFVKRDKLVIIAGRGAAAKRVDPSSKEPRVIHPRDARFNCHLARFLKRNEHRVFAMLNEVFDETGHGIPTIMKGLNASEQGEAIFKAWHRFQKPVGIRLDFSRFDQHVSKEALLTEHLLYKTMFHKAKGLGLCSAADYKELEWLLAQQIHNRCSMYLPDGKLHYRTKGKRMSGDINTGLGNVVIVCMMFLVLMKDLGFGAADYHLVNNGDDCCLVVEKDSLERVLKALQPFFIRLGFELDIEGVSDELESVMFCQSKPVEVTPTTWVMIRDLDTSRVKDAINLQRMTTKTDFDKWRSAVAGCGLALCSGVPIMQDYYLALTRGVTPHHSQQFECGRDFLARGMLSRVRDVTDTARASFFFAFGITPDHQIAMENYYKELTPTFSLHDAIDEGVMGVLDASC